MDKITALILLQSALDHCREEDIQTPEVFAALSFLAAQTTVTWPFDQFRLAALVKPDSDGWEAEGRWQILNAALNGIKSAVHRP